MGGSRGHGPDRGTPGASERTDVDVYFSVDVETDGPIPGMFSMLSFAIVPAGRYDGMRFDAPRDYSDCFYAELQPIAESFQEEALAVNRLDRVRLQREGEPPAVALGRAAEFILARCQGGTPILVAYPLSFDWSWLYWYFVRFHGSSPFNHSRCFDIKTAVAIRSGRPVSQCGRDRIPSEFRVTSTHTHHARDDAIEQAAIFVKVMEGAHRPT